MVIDPDLTIHGRNLPEKDLCHGSAAATNGVVLIFQQNFVHSTHCAKSVAG
jgi:hypothetical protein